MNEPMATLLQGEIARLEGLRDEAAASIEQLGRQAAYERERLASFDMHIAAYKRALEQERAA